MEEKKAIRKPKPKKVEEPAVDIKEETRKIVRNLKSYALSLRAAPHPHATKVMKRTVKELTKLTKLLNL